MAKGQRRSNREIRKPKKDRTATNVEIPKGAPFKLVENISVQGRKPKK
jgi:hypothetical protein